MYSNDPMNTFTLEASTMDPDFVFLFLYSQREVRISKSSHIEILTSDWMMSIICDSSDVRSLSEIQGHDVP